MSLTLVHLPSRPGIGSRDDYARRRRLHRMAVMNSPQKLLTVAPVATELGIRFRDSGFELSLVGGPVRDLFLGRDAPDLDFTTNANPEQILDLVRGWADAIWEIGRDFGTIGLRKNGEQIEITTYRAEKYDAASRKPEVQFGTSLHEDLLRRDFTINAMAIRLPDNELVDPFGGIKDLHAGLLRTPAAAEDSFSDDPLRMMRAARFIAQLDVRATPEVLGAMKAMAQRLSIISAERIRDELIKLINAALPAKGVRVLVETGLADVVLPEIPALRLTVDAEHRHKDVYEHSLKVLTQAAELETGPDGALPGPDFILRFAALMHDVGKPSTRRFDSGAVSFRHHDVVGAKITARRMKELRFDNDTIKAVSRLVELHMRFYGYGDAGWTDSAVRRYVADAGGLLQRLHRLTRADVTTKNQRKADRLSFAYDDLEARIAVLAEQEELDAIRPDLDGQEIMALLGLKPGPVVGQAYKFLLQLRMDEGPVGKDEARRRLLDWNSERFLDAGDGRDRHLDVAPDAKPSETRTEKDGDN